MAQKPINQISHKPGKMSEEVDYALTEIKQAMNFIDNMNVRQMKEQLTDLSRDYQNRILNGPSINDLASSINICVDQIAKIKEAVIALAQKLDNENVSELNSDYEIEVKSKL